MFDEKQNEEMKIGSQAWSDLQTEIVDKFSPGETIKHDWLKTKFNFKDLRFADYECEIDFVKSLQLQQFAYMTLIDSLRWEILEVYKIYLKNIRGEGYILLPASEQVTYAYDKAIDSIKKEIKDADLIMSNVKIVDPEQQSKDNDLRARWGMLKQLLKSVK